MDAAPWPASPSVVLVDSSADERAMYAHALRANGFSPFEFSDGDRAFSFASTTNPKLVITDAVLEDGDGFDFTRRLRQDGRTEGIGIIVLSGRVINEQAASEAALDAGADVLLVKPCSPDRLARAAVALLARGVLTARSENERERGKP